MRADHKKSYGNVLDLTTRASGRFNRRVALLSLAALRRFRRGGLHGHAALRVGRRDCVPAPAPVWKLSAHS